MLIERQDVDGGVRVLALNRPPANAINAELLRALGEAVREAAGDERVRAVVVRGNERFFSAGLDLKELAAGGAGELAGLGRDDGLFLLWTLPKPTVAEVAGHAVAGGAVIALACDVRITREGTHKIGLNENAFGIGFPREAFEMARLALAPQHFGRLILEGMTLAPGEAAAVGYVHEVVPADRLEARCLEIARRLATYPPHGYAHNKRLVQEPARARCAAETDEARRRLLDLWTSPATIAGVMGRLAEMGRKG